MLAHKDIRKAPSPVLADSFLEEEIKEYTELFDIQNQYTGKTWEPLDANPTRTISQPGGDSQICLRKQTTLKDRKRLQERLEALRTQKSEGKLSKEKMQMNQQHLDLLYQQAFSIRKRRDLLKIENRQKEKNELAGPALSRKTLEITSKNRDSSLKVEDRLICQGAKTKFLLSKKQEENSQALKEMAAPAISSYSQRLARSGSVQDRLLLFQTIYASHREKKRQQTSPEETFSPQINANYPLAKPSSVFISKKAQSTYQEEYSFKPALNKNSLRIASQLSPKRPESSTVREEEYPFHPEINETSRKLDINSKRSLSPRWHSLYNMNLDHRERMELKRKEKLLKDSDVECTFRPTITAGTLNGNPNTVQRLYQWEDRKLVKRKKMQEEKEKKQFEECTFSPNPLYKSKADTEMRKKAEDFLGSLMISRIQPLPATYLEIYSNRKVPSPGSSVASLARPFFDSDITSNAYGEAIKELHDLLHVDV